jgi:hypothetical protein
MSRQALASWLPPEPKFIFDGSLTGRLSGSSPARVMEGYKDMIVESVANDIVYTNLFTGV